MLNVKRNQLALDILGGFSVVLLALDTYGFLPSFLYLTERVSIPPRYFAFLLLLSTLSFLAFKWRESCKNNIWKPAIIWFMSAFLLVLVYYLLGKFGYLYLVNECATAFFHGLIIIMCTVILLNTGGDRLFFLLCQVMKILFLIACLTIIYDYYFPGDFVSQKSEFSNFGRGAGYYVNANGAGTAIICGWVFIFLLYKSNEKYFYFLTAMGFYALLLTFSRSAWLALAFSLFMALLFRIVKPRKFVNITIIAMLCFILFKSILYFYFLADDHRQAYQWMEAHAVRINFSENSLLDHSALDRVACMKAAIDAINISPIFGNGIGSVQYLFDKSPHNSYLELWADYGILGLLLNCSLIVILFLMFYRKNNDAGEFCFFTGSIVLVAGIFSHALISNGPLLLLIAISFSNFSFGFVRR